MALVPPLMFTGMAPDECLTVNTEAISDRDTLLANETENPSGPAGHDLKPCQSE
jgi:hypothetical protein